MKKIKDFKTIANKIYQATNNERFLLEDDNRRSLNSHYHNLVDMYKVMAIITENNNYGYTKVNTLLEDMQLYIDKLDLDFDVDVNDYLYTNDEMKAILKGINSNINSNKDKVLMIASALDIYDEYEDVGDLMVAINVGHEQDKNATVNELHHKNFFTLLNYFDENTIHLEELLPQFTYNSNVDIGSFDEVYRSM